MLIAITDIEVRRFLFLILPLFNFVVIYLLYMDNRHTLTPRHRKTAIVMGVLFVVGFLALTVLIIQADA